MTNQAQNPKRVCETLNDSSAVISAHPLRGFAGDERLLSS